MKQFVISHSITQRDYKSLDKYFSEINKIGLLTGQEEAMLARKIREGDQQALHRLTKTNLRFVISVAKQYQNQGLTLGDLINEGNIGLISAAKRFDETKGFKFISYAVWWIRQAIISSIAAHARTVRLPYCQLTLLNKISSATSKLEQQYGRKPVVEEVAAHLDITSCRVCELLSKSNASISMNDPLKNDEEHLLSDILQSTEPDADDAMMHESIKKEIHQAMRVLRERDREIVILFFGLGPLPPQSMQEISERLQISIEVCRRLKEQALSQLRRAKNALVLKSLMS
jgi:RNA polymerase primary sigma factor